MNNENSFEIAGPRALK